MFGVVFVYDSVFVGIFYDSDDDDDRYMFHMMMKS